MNRIKLISTGIIVVFILLFSTNIKNDFNETKTIIQQNKNTRQEIKEINTQIKEIKKMEKDESVIEMKKVNSEIKESIAQLEDENELLNKEIENITTQRLNILNTKWEADITDFNFCSGGNSTNKIRLTGKLKMEINDTGVIIKLLSEEDNKETTISAEIVSVDEELGIYTIKSISDNHYSDNFSENKRLLFYIAVKEGYLTCWSTYKYDVWDYYDYNQAFILKQL
ncbi:hypothetical protein [Turicibacter sp. H121]|uniref:hypothetical protein n=1 Tax=Turicibacter sp. H121 TaxID=1712675 RepID=UPI0007632202|nr:hypothetical protein [Turicibacter sp. H121]AMC08270.1 hypothetical protein AT726_04435 [Turicibacter sp. H121]MCU7200153.1 hypothetical protein [Turicibacter sp. H121]